MSKSLELKFLDTEGKTKTLTIREPEPNLDEATVRQVMDDIVNQQLFENEGNQLYVQVKSARYVDRLVTDVFDNSKA